MIKILLACGAGCSSGLVAQSMRKYAKKNNIECTVRAIGDADVLNNVADYDVLMLGPHLKHIVQNVESYCKQNEIKTIIKVITKEQYAMLDGESVFKDALELLKNK